MYNTVYKFGISKIYFIYILNGFNKFIIHEDALNWSI